MKIPVNGLSGLHDTNAFLRALWSGMRTSFGKCAWNYQPYKEGQRREIVLGWMDLGLANALAVTLSYKTREILAAIEISEGPDKEVDPDGELGHRLRAVVEKAIAGRNAPRNYFLKTPVEALRMPVAHYAGEWFSIMPGASRQMDVTMRVQAFDQIDAKAEAMRRLPQLLDVLAVETNQLFWSVTRSANGDGAKAPATESALAAVPALNTFSWADDWMDEYPIANGHLLISREAPAFIDRILAPGALCETDANFARACHHFHTARQQDALVTDRLIALPATRTMEGMVLNFEEDERTSFTAQFAVRAEELATVLYVSAIEVASAIGVASAGTCEKCGQEVYKISARVVDYVAKGIGGSGAIADIFKSYYRKRSKYLHAGVVVVDHAYTGTTIPLFDPSSDAGVTQLTSVSLLNMREWTGYLLRSQLKQILKAGAGENHA